MIDPLDFERLTDVEWRQHVESEHGIFIAEGMTTIERALEAGFLPRAAVTTARWHSQLLELGVAANRISVLTDIELERLTGFHVHRGAIAAFDRPPEPAAPALLATARSVLVLEDVLDHTNVGAIMRAAAAFGINAVLLTPNCADPLYRRAIKVSMGTVFSVTWARCAEPVELLRNRGFHTYALTPSATASDIRELDPQRRPERFALVLGTEGDGLRRSTLVACDEQIRIPMATGVDSLNVAAAAAVACYELTR